MWMIMFRQLFGASFGLGWDENGVWHCEAVSYDGNDLDGRDLCYFLEKH